MADALRPTLGGGRPIGRPDIAMPEAERASSRSVAIPRIPAHVGVMLGLSAAGYALTLATVTGLQSAGDASVIADRAPVGVALDRLATGHDRLGGKLDAAGSSYAEAAAAYEAAARRIRAVEEALGALSTSVAKVDGAARALPAAVALPPVIRAVRGASQPVAHATSGGSAAP